METKEEIEEFLKPYLESKSNGLDLTELIQRALDHFKPQTVISNSEIEEMSNKYASQYDHLGLKGKILSSNCFTNGAKAMRSKLSTTVTEPKDNWTNEKPKEIGLYFRSNPALQKDISPQIVYNVEGVLKTVHPQCEGGKLIPVEDMPDRFIWLRIPYPPHYKKSYHELPQKPKDK